MGEPTSSAPSGVIVAAFSPSPASRIAAAASIDDPVRRRPAVLERQVEVLELELEPEQVAVEHPQRLLEQLLPGLVAVQDDDRRPGRRSRSGRRSSRRRAGRHQLVAALGQRRDHDRQVLVEVDAELLGAARACPRG